MGGMKIGGLFFMKIGRIGNSGNLVIKVYDNSASDYNGHTRSRVF